MSAGVPEIGPAGALAGFVLAGGKSSRMGRDKALLEMDGQPLVSRAAGLVRKAAGSAVIVGDPHRYQSLGFPVIGDALPGLGPIGGLLTALESRRATWNLVVACDMPGLTAGVLSRVIGGIREAGNSRCIVPVSSHGIEPLCGLYHVDCLPEVRRAIASKRLAMRDLVAQLDAMQLVGFEASAFENVNRPAEWATFKGSS